MRRSRRIKALVVGAVVATLAIGIGCSSVNNKDVHASSQFYTCIYDHEDGNLIKKLPPGGGKVNVENDAEVWLVPTSQRFYNVDPDPAIADPGAKQFITGKDKNYQDVQAVVHVEFYFNQEKICDFVDRHGKRNVDPAVIDDGDVEDKMGFNVRGKADEPWFVFLNEKFGPALQSQGELLFNRFEWDYYEFSFPANANIDGVVPEGETPAPIARDSLEAAYAESFTEELNTLLSGEFFCGAGYDPENPDECPELTVQIVDIGLTDPARVDERQQQLDLREQADNDRREAQLTRDATAAALELQEAQLSQEQQLQDQVAQYGGVIPEVAEAQRQLQLEQIAQQQAALPSVAVCQLVRATGDDCARLIAAVNGQYPQGNGTNVNVTPGG